MPSTTTSPRSQTTSSPRNRFLRMPEVCELVGLGRTAIYTAMRKGKFPLPVKLGSQLNAWRLSEIETWMEARPRNIELGPDPAA